MNLINSQRILSLIVGNSSDKNLVNTIWTQDVTYRTKDVQGTTSTSSEL